MGLVFGEWERNSMKKKNKIVYTDYDIGEIEIINKDFLPKPEDLVFKEDNVKITVLLSRSSVDFFKKHAKKYKTQYQKMIRNLLDRYVASHR